MLKWRELDPKERLAALFVGCMVVLGIAYLVKGMIFH